MRKGVIGTDANVLNGTKDMTTQPRKAVSDMTKDLSTMKQIEEMTLIIHKIMPIGLELSAAVAADLYNAGFRKMCSERNAYGHADPVGEPGTEGEPGIHPKVAEYLLSKLKKEAHNKAVHSQSKEIQSYITLRDLDDIIQKLINEYYGGK